MKKINLLIAVLLVLSIVACKNSNNNNQISEKEKAIQEISSSEEVLFSELEPDKEKATAMIEQYLTFVDSYPEDTICAEYLFKASEIAMNFNQPHNSIRYLTQIETSYLDYSKYPTCIFMKGFIYHYEIQDLEKAREYYQRYIDNYPEHTFVKDAEGALMFMGLNDDELIELFEDMNKYN